MSSPNFETPEIMLARLNRRLVALRGVLAPLGDTELDEGLADVLRATFVAQLLHEHTVVAVAGVQGAGKTTLVQQLLMPPRIDKGDGTTGYAYPPGALDWLEPNLGRGEKIPLLVLERQTCTEPEARMFHLREVENRYEIVDEPMERAGFQKSLGELKGTQLCPLLVVPPTIYGGSDAGFVLLPGYEFIRRDNRGFQEFMRQTMVGARSTIIVTDRTSLADKRSKVILDDLKKDFFEGSQPIIAIARTEHDSDQEREQLRSEARDKFEIPENEADRVVCVGTGAFVGWKPKLRNAINRYHAVGAMARSRQIRYLADTLRNVAIVMADAERAIRIKDIPQGEDDRNVRDILDAFDVAARNLRRDYAKALDSVIGEFRQSAAEAVEVQVRADGSKLKRFKSWVSDMFISDPVKFLEQRDLIEDHWHNRLGQTFADAHFDLLSNVTAATYRLTGAQPSIASTSDKRALLAYDSVGDEPGQSSGSTAVVRRIDPAVQTNLQALFTPDRDGMLDLKTNKELKNAIRTLPALALELGRMATLSTSVRNSLEYTERPDLVETARQMEQDFGSLGGSASSIIKGLAIMLGIDFAADGHVDTVPAFWAALTGTGVGAATATSATGGAAAASGGAAAGGLATVSSGATAVAAGLVAVIMAAVVVNQIKRMETERYGLGQQIASAYSDCYREHCMEGFDGAMTYIRDVLLIRLEQRYRLDEAMTRSDRQRATLAGARSALDDLQEAIGARPPTLV